MTQPPDAEATKAFNAKIAEEFRANAGEVDAFKGNELLLLTTTGAKSGQPRLSPLSCKRIDGKLVVIGGYGGADVTPAWVHNLRANRRARVELGTESFDVLARELLGADRDEIVPKVVAIAPQFEVFQANVSRVIPIFELVPIE
ncbi:nitroreductase/quinone reductase family protein [Mycobacterium sp. NPDC048908]|uniref:nitroreductase/quinone reductase family protein n=1 Tax=Mycobacterium sp. NPDC048908 TaxID=3364292 RepID=UPI00371A2222